MTQSMITRVARAILDAWDKPQSQWTYDDLEQEGFIDMAKAALSAMLEPTEGMVYIAVEGAPEDNEGIFTSHDAENVWRAMIRAALEEE